MSEINDLKMVATHWREQTENARAELYKREDILKESREENTRLRKALIDIGEAKMTKGRKKRTKNVRRTVAGLNIGGKKLTAPQFMRQYNTLWEANKQLRERNAGVNRYLSMLHKELSGMRDALLDEEHLDASEINDVVDVLDKLLEPLDITESKDNAPAKQTAEQAS